MRKLLKRSLYRLIFSYIYAFLGALLFYYLERKPERNREIYSRLARKLHQEFTNQFNVSINESNFKQFMEKAFQVVLVGNKPDWSILGGLSFTMTSLTTVGEYYARIHREVIVYRLVHKDTCLHRKGFVLCTN